MQVIHCPGCDAEVPVPDASIEIVSTAGLSAMWYRHAPFLDCPKCFAYLVPSESQVVMNWRIDSRPEKESLIQLVVPKGMT
jgi:hypothetical protein